MIFCFHFLLIFSFVPSILTRLFIGLVSAGAPLQLLGCECLSNFGSIPLSHSGHATISTTLTLLACFFSLLSVLVLPLLLQFWVLLLLCLHF